MTQLSKLSIGAIAVALVAAGAGIGYAIGHDNGNGNVRAAGRPPATVLGERLEASTTTSTTTTSTTAAVQAGTAGPQPSTPTTSLTSTQTTSATVVTQAGTGTTTTPATSPPATAAGGACGTGSASASATAHIAPVRPTSNPDFRTDVSVEVVSKMDRPIELDRILVRLDFDDGSSETHPLGVAGTVMGPGERSTFSASYVTRRAPTNVAIADFAWHTAGQPQCVGRAA